MKRLAAATAAITLMLSGCSTLIPMPMAPTGPMTPFDAAAHAEFAKPGSGSIAGQGFLRQGGGGVVTCAGSPVLLFPATQYFRESMAIAATGRQLLPAPQEAQQAVRRSTCDAQGNFSFASLPAGAFIVGTEVKWHVGYQQQGGGLVREVAVIDGQPTQVFLTEADYVAR